MNLGRTTANNYSFYCLCQCPRDHGSRSQPEPYTRRCGIIIKTQNQKRFLIVVGRRPHADVRSLIVVFFFSFMCCPLKKKKNHTHLCPAPCPRASKKHQPHLYIAARLKTRLTCAPPSPHPLPPRCFLSAQCSPAHPPSPCFLVGCAWTCVRACGGGGGCRKSTYERRGTPPGPRCSPWRKARTWRLLPAPTPR